MKKEFKLAFNDIKLAISMSSAASELAWQEIKLRFRGSTLGPFWYTLSIAIQVIALSYVYSSVFNIGQSDYVKWLASSLICWQYMSFILNDSVGVLFHNRHIFGSHKVPYSFFSLKSSFLGLYIFVLQLPVYFFLSFYIGANVSVFSVLTFIGSVFFVFLFSFVINLFFGILALRYQDIPQIIAIILNLSFLVTPILWRPAMAGSRIHFLKFNPFYYILEIMRAPLLGSELSVTVYWGAFALFIFVSIIAFCFFAKNRSKLVFLS